MTNKDKELNSNSNGENQTKSDHSPPMAVLPLNSSTKLDQEPNPFEQSFSGASSEEKMGNMNNSNKLTLPPVASLTSPAITKSALNNGNGVVIGGGILPKEVANQFTWDTLRTGPLSPSMLQGPANPDDYYGKSNNSMPPNTTYSTRSSFATTSTLNTTNNDMQYMQQPIKIEQQQYMPQQQPQKRQRSISQNTDNDSIGSNDSSVINKKTNKKSTRNTTRRRSSNLVTDSGNEDDVSMREKSKSSSKEPEDDEKRKNFLERNRIAALKCRQRKKQWLNNLQAKVEFLSSDNERLQLQSESLKEEIVNLKTLLLAHKECPVAQSNGFHASAIQKGGMPSMLSQQQQMMGRNSAPYGLNRQQPPPPQPASASTSSSIPRYTRTNMNIQSQDNQTMMAGGNTANGNNVGAGGTSSVLRF